MELGRWFAGGARRAAEERLAARIDALEREVLALKQGPARPPEEGKPSDTQIVIE